MSQLYTAEVFRYLPIIPSYWRTYRKYFVVK